MEPPITIAKSTAVFPFSRPRLACHGRTKRILTPSLLWTLVTPSPTKTNDQPARHFSSHRPCFKSKPSQDANGDKIDLAGQSDEVSAERARYAKSLSTILRSSNSNTKDTTHMVGTSTHTIPSELYELTFARSSGAGGQNVNKLNTKAVLRFFLGKAQENKIANGYQSDHAVQRSLLPLPMPKAVANWIAEKSPHYTAATHSIVLNSSAERSQAANKKDVLNKLLAHIEEIINDGLRGETSQESLDKLAANKRKFDAQRKKEKMYLKAKTARRRGGD